MTALILLIFLQNKSKKGIYNVSTGVSRTFLDLSKIIFKNLNYDFKVKYIPMPKKIKNGYQYMTEVIIKILEKSVININSQALRQVLMITSINLSKNRVL